MLVIKKSNVPAPAPAPAVQPSTVRTIKRQTLGTRETIDGSLVPQALEVGRPDDGKSWDSQPTQRASEGQIRPAIADWVKTVQSWPGAVAIVALPILQRMIEESGEAYAEAWLRDKGVEYWTRPLDTREGGLADDLDGITDVQMDLSYLADAPF